MSLNIISLEEKIKIEKKVERFKELAFGDKVQRREAINLYNLATEEVKREIEENAKDYLKAARRPAI